MVLAAWHERHRTLLYKLLLHTLLRKCLPDTLLYKLLRRTRLYKYPLHTLLYKFLGRTLLYSFLPHILMLPLLHLLLPHLVYLRLTRYFCLRPLRPSLSLVVAWQTAQTGPLPARETAALRLGPGVHTLPQTAVLPQKTRDSLRLRLVRWTSNPPARRTKGWGQAKTSDYSKRDRTPSNYSKRPDRTTLQL